MKMDKSLFLLLTGTIAGVGTACVIHNVPDPATAPPATTAPTSTTAAGPTAPATTPPAPGVDPGARRVTPGQIRSIRGAGGDSADGGAPPPPPAAACLDDSAPATGDCGTIADKSCTWASKRCTAYKTFLKGKVASNAIACTVAASNACSGTATADCGRSAMKAACPDTSVAQACSTLATKCKDTADNCTAAFSALNSAGQQKALVYCAGEGGCTSGVAACVEAALFPAAEGATSGGLRRR